MLVRDIMTKDVIYAEVPGSASEALELLLKKNVSGLPVVKRGTKEIVGVVTRNDFSRNPDESQLALLMTRNVKTITPDADIMEAVKIFKEEGFRRLPVVENSDLIGIVTVSDIVWRAIARMNITEGVENYMEESLTAIWEGTPLKVAYELMRLSGARALPVLDSDNALVGMIGDTDVLKVIELTESTEKSEISSGTEGDRWGWDSKSVVYIMKKKFEVPNITVKDLMVKKVITVTKKTPVSECAKRMADARIEQVPVIDAEGRITGIVRDINLLHALK
jgi:CBS domain-containing protein